MWPVVSVSCVVDEQRFAINISAPSAESSGRTLQWMPIGLTGVQGAVYGITPFIKVWR
jgi:hypothetical protein